VLQLVHGEVEERGRRDGAARGGLERARGGGAAAEDLLLPTLTPHSYKAMFMAPSHIFE
jgi:hypothetical protein